jgi:hypothetical protein
LEVRGFLTCALAGALLLVVAVTSDAIVPPKNCGTITVKHRRYQIKADQLPCSTAKTYASRYLSTGTRPRGYKCHRYSGSALVARCENTRANPDRTIFIIKR